MTKWITNVKATFDRTFPERQIYHRSGGTVRFVSISPWQQAICAAGAVAFTGWSLFATGAFILDSSAGPAATTDAERETLKTQRYVQDLRAKEATVRTMLDERTEVMQKESEEIEDRLKAIESLVDELKSDDNLELSALQGDGASLLVHVSIDEADSRQSRDRPIVTAKLDTRETRVAINPWAETEERVLQKAEEVAIERTEAMRGVLALTSVGTDRIMANAGEGMGGPLLPVDDMLAGKATSPAGKAFYQRLAQTSARIAEMQHYESIIKSLPLSRPVGVTYHQTSNYGLRVDPFTKRPATHAGLDLAAYRNAPIVAAGPGVVTFAGVKSGYGRLVEIDHGNGFKTRYGHLHSITVSEGTEVATGDHVGGMGSTGRSTGDHLHYEVWFNSKPHDPAHFLKAGRHVYKK